MNGETQDESDLKSLLFALETQLMDPVFRRDRGKVAALLADGFREFGSSGREWSREAILDALAEESAWTAPSVEGFAIQQIEANSVLITYRTLHPDKSSLRSSIWVSRDRRWQMIFHQGTKIPNP